MATTSEEDERLYSIGELAREFAVTTRAIRFYEAKGLIRPARKGAARSYSRRDRARLILILRGKHLGFSLEDVGEYLKLYDADPTQVLQLQHLKAKLDSHIKELRRKRAHFDSTLRELNDMRAEVVRALKQRSATDGAPSKGRRKSHPA